MTAFALLAVLTVIAFAGLAIRVRSEWTRSEDLRPATAVGISALYVLVAALLAIALVHRPWPIAMPLALAIAVGGPLLVGGLAVVVLGARPFGSSARLYGVETGGLVEGGIYRLSRNPQYAGLIAVVLAAAILGRSGLALAVAALVAAALWVWVIAVEEPHLATVFGPRYMDYRRRVPRFLGLPRA